jgi:hypothetical protein
VEAELAYGATEVELRSFRLNRSKAAALVDVADLRRRLLLIRAEVAKEVMALKLIKERVSVCE